MSKGIIAQLINAYKLTQELQRKEDAIFKEFQNKVRNKEEMKNTRYPKVILKAFGKKRQNNIMDFGDDYLQVQLDKKKKMKIEIKKEGNMGRE